MLNPSILWEYNIYGYIKEELFHFSDEQGDELKREEMGIPNGVIVFDIVDEKDKWLKERTSCKGKGLAVDGQVLDEHILAPFGSQYYVI